METRKVQITGGSTYTISLPKHWTRENDVTEGSIIAMFSKEDGLVLTPHENDNRSESHISARGLDDEAIVRAVITMYVSGFDVITIDVDRITPDKRRAIRFATQTLTGLEVVEERGGTIVVQDLLSTSRLSISDAISRMRVITLSMMSDAITALIESNTELAQEIIKRDNDVDTLWFVVSRTFRQTLRTPAAVEEIGHPREICFDLYTVARQLERIADHAAKISHVTLELDEIPENVARAITQLHEETDAVINTAMKAFGTDDRKHATRLANEALESKGEIGEHSRDIDELLRDLDRYQAQQLRLVVDSLSRCADYGGNVAETALQKAAPRP